MNVLSLCDGMSCGHIALDKVGIKVDKYFAAEIKDIAIKVTKSNYPETIHIGNVNNITYKNGVLNTDVGNFKTNIDLVIFGSPCQTFSICMRTEHRIGTEDKEKSGLFLECYRILKEVNPKYFLMENVASMKDEDRDVITNLLGVKPININSSLLSAQMRNRYYWTNIPNVTIPSDKHIMVNDILNTGYYPKDKARCLLVSDSRPLTTPIKMFYRWHYKGFNTVIFKDEEHYKQCIDAFKRITDGKKISAKLFDDYKGNDFDDIRYVTQDERERLQTVPNGYTQCLTNNEAADVLGDGWTVDVISHIFKGLTE